MTPDMTVIVDSALRGDWTLLLETASHTEEKNWAEKARCAGQVTDIFLPPSDGPREDAEEVRRKEGEALDFALGFCAACPVSVAARCLLEALRQDEEYGIRAGLLACERAELRDAWKRRVDTEAVSAALRGVTTLLSRQEREEVVARFANEQGLDADRVAQGLGVSRKYLWQLVREYRQRVRQGVTSASASERGASRSDAA